MEGYRSDKLDILTVVLQRQTTCQMLSTMISSHASLWQEIFYEMQLLKFRQAFYGRTVISLRDNLRYLNEVHGTPAVKIEWHNHYVPI